MITIDKKIIICLSLYLTSLFAVNTLGLKIMPFIFHSHISVGIFSFPIVFLMTDVISEVYGKQMAQYFVLAGFLSTLLFMGYSLLSIFLPWAQAGLWAKESYNIIFGVSTRIALASLVAFIIGEYQDVLTFFFVRRITNGKMFWLRSFISNVWSQLLDTVIFMAIAFAGIYSIKNLLVLITTWWLYKVGMGVLFTPLSYTALWLLKGKENNESYAN